MTDFKLDFAKQDGLIPVIVTDYQTNQVLMLAYMNEESYQLTLETKEMHYWSRSRQEIWHKGETSGHYQYVKSIKTDCDQDTLLIAVKQKGAACHTGAYSCFFKDIYPN
ncbi:phosphoribosyl-AMP cyclohydrolase [Streptococcus sp. H31]|uniref:phosphoribosyl-AMP cyclohydrolase n=1 Tax=Streptococcus huangxiaojuni TaxID=3237239 RepID=UPI0034A596BF